MARPSGTKPAEATTSQQITALKREVADLRRQLAAFYQAADQPTGSASDEQETSNSVAHYRALIELSPQVVWMTDASGNNIYCNKHWYDYTGLTVEETLGEGWTAALHPDDLRAATDVRRKAAEADLNSEWEMRLRRASDGQYRWHLCRWLAIKDLSSKVLTRVGIAVDIHDRKIAATAIAEANERMLLAVEAAEACTFDYYPQKDKIELSPRGLEIFQAPGGELTPDHFLQVIHPKDRERIVGVLERAMDPAIGGDYQADYRIIWPDGTEHWLLANGRCFFAGEGAAREAERISGIILDITARKEAERDRAALVAALQNSPDFVIITDLRGRLLFLNSAGREMVGLDDDQEARSKTAYDFLAPKEQAIVEKEIIPMLRTGRVWEGEFCLRHFVSGEPLPVETRVFGIRDEEGRLTALMNRSRDVSQKRKLEEQLRLVQKLEAVGRLAGGIAHDFNNLLTVIRGAAEVLQERWQEYPASLATINEISDAAQRASTLTEQLLAFGRRQMVRPRPVDLNQVILRAEAMLRRLAGEDVVVKTQLPENLWKVKMDPIQADQILINLAANARDAMPNGGSITIATRNLQLPQETDPTSLKPGHYVGLSFSDNGQGIEAETLSRIFEPFFTTKEAENRSGLGLSTVYGIVRQCAGDIVVRSTPGQGSCFTLYLPRITEDVSACESEEDTSLLQGSGNILLVEDEASLRFVVAGYLREHGYVVYEAGDAQEALKTPEKARVDLLLTDIVMPGNSGPELAASLAAENHDMRVIFMSGYAEHAALQRAILQPKGLFIQKPFRLRTLLARIHEALDDGDGAVRNVEELGN